MDDQDFADRLAKAKDGDDAAVRALLLRYEDEVRMVVRGRLPKALRTQFDSMDFVQVVWQNVFTGQGPDLTQFENPRHFFGYLAGVARNKVLEEHRRRTRTKKYDLGREEPLYVRRGDREVPREVAATEPSPSQGAQARDRLDQLMTGRTPQEQQVVDLRRIGLTYEEVALRLGLHEGAVRRIVKTIERGMGGRQ